MAVHVPGGGGALPGLQKDDTRSLRSQPTPCVGPRKRSAAGQSIRLRSLYFRAAGQANTASYCCAAGGAAFCLSFAILSWMALVLLAASAES